ncbi:MAG TPA: LysR family transcriptional regulator [Ramlibacter sp.]|nr:LysR family transcriptional regulator [Ramlibacter sp.]
MSAFNKLHLIRQVDLFTLKLFVSAVEERQIARAAAHEHIAASAATKRIQDLEDITGLKLLERAPKGVVATPAGEVLVRYVRHIFGSLDDMRAELATFAEGVRGQLTVASIRSLIVTHVAREIAEFTRNFPLVEVQLKELPNRDVVDAVTHGAADVGVFVANSGLDLSLLDAVTYIEDAMVAVVHDGHPLAARDGVSFQEMLDFDFVAIETGAALNAAFHGAAKLIGREFKPRYLVQSVEVASSLVQVGLGVTLMPRRSLLRDVFDRVALVPLLEPWARTDARVATLKSTATAPAARAFIQQLLDRPRGVVPSDPA